jgi:alkylation response protein AidB-like acyl-CoA dehydrogenase
LPHYPKKNIPNRILAARRRKFHIRGDDIVTKVSMAKAWLGEMVNRVAYQAVQLHGGYGYMEEYRISRLFRDARSCPSSPAPPRS